jgi:flagellar basal body L-ring protein FlgH
MLQILCQYRIESVPMDNLVLESRRTGSPARASMTSSAVPGESFSWTQPPSSNNRQRSATLYSSRRAPATPLMLTIILGERTRMAGFSAVALQLDSPRNRECTASLRNAARHSNTASCRWTPELSASTYRICNSIYARPSEVDLKPAHT